MLRTVLIALLFAAGTALAQSDAGFEVGTHYNRLTPTQPTSSSPEQIEVAEVFWYGCPHCYNFDPFLADWKPGIAEDVNFVRVPAVWNPLVRLHAQAFYTAQALGKEEEMHDAFFAEIHQNGNYLDSPEKLATFFARFDVDRDAFAEAFNSRDINERLQRAEELSNRYQIQSVPSIVVNGKYTSNASMTGSYERLISLIDSLTTAERSAE